MRTLLALAGVAVVVAAVPDSAARPFPWKTSAAFLRDLPEFDRYKADAYLDAASRLQTMGRRKAVAALADFGGADDPRMGRRAVLLCRMLFVPKPGQEFRRPSIGAPCFVSRITATRRSVTALGMDWPTEPIDLVDGVPFLVVTGYSVGGYPEPGREYLDYCNRNCNWNPHPFGPKTPEQKRAALDKLLASPRWAGPVSDEGKRVLAAQIE